MNGFTEYQNNIFNIVRDAGYVGTQEQLFDMMQQQTYFDSTFSLVRQAGFEGNERDFIFLAGVAPKKKDSALSEEYSTLLGYGVEGGGLDVQTDTTVPPIERETNCHDWRHDKRHYRVISLKVYSDREIEQIS